MSDGAPIASAAPEASPDPREPVEGLRAMVVSLGELAEDPSVPKNIRRGAVEARAELERRGTATDVRIAGAISRLDDLANEPNLPSHGRTAIWSLISRLERLQ